MTSEHKMHFPFTIQKEILGWETCYIEGQSEKRQRQEQAVIEIKNAVNALGFSRFFVSCPIYGKRLCLRSFSEF